MINVSPLRNVYQVVIVIIFLRNFRICVCTLNLNENIYEITHGDAFQHQQLNCCFKSLLRLTTKKTSRRRISGHLWGDCNQNITASCILHKMLNTDGHIWTTLFLTAFNNTDMTVLRKYITTQWRYVRDMASHITGNSTIVFRVNKCDIKTQHYWPLVRESTGNLSLISILLSLLSISLF